MILESSHPSIVMEFEKFSIAHSRDRHDYRPFFGTLQLLLPKLGLRNVTKFPFSITPFGCILCFYPDYVSFLISIFLSIMYRVGTSLKLITAIIISHRFSSPCTIYFIQWILASVSMIFSILVFHVISSIRSPLSFFLFFLFILLPMIITNSYLSIRF